MCTDYRGVKPPTPYRSLREHRETLRVRGRPRGEAAARPLPGARALPFEPGMAGRGGCLDRRYRLGSRRRLPALADPSDPPIGPTHRTHPRLPPTPTHRTYL